ncbi:MAG: membrane protein insertase YidC [Planctomycetota bacterium]|jgi:YidC/Oxa1 family membrane protein insertase
MNKRTAVAVVITVVFFVFWRYCVIPRLAPPPPPPAETETVVEETGAEPDRPAEAPTVREEPAAPVAQAPTAQPPVAQPPRERPQGDIEIPEQYRQENLVAEEFAVSTDLLEVNFTTLTGSVKSVTLLTFDDFERQGKLTLLDDFTTGRFPTAIESFDGADLAQRLWLREDQDLESEGGEKRVVFSTILESGVKLTKTYTLFPGRYGLGLDVAVENLNGSEREASYILLGTAGIPSEDLRRRDVQGVLATVPAGVGIEGKMSVALRPAARFMAVGKKGGPLATTPAERVNFAGTVNRYFAAVMRPSTDVPVENAWCDAVYDEGLEISGLEGMTAPEAREKYAPDQLRDIAGYFYTAGATFAIGPDQLGAAGGEGSTAVHRYLVYCGPKDKKALVGFDGETLSTGFPALLDYGLLEPLIKIILWFLRVFHAGARNWGVAIILLTLLMRAFMHPLMRKSHTSMAKMQRLQPQIKKLQEKYKKDKQRLGQEQMKLMKEHGANPLGGCLPLFIQMPIFFSLYRSLMLSIELRQSPFFLWIDDLAQPDRLATLPFVIPLLGTNFLNLLPILMATAMVLQQKMMPKPPTADAAQQQKMMMMFMPIFLGWILYSVASGLNLYILTTTCFGMLEQWWIRRHLDATEAKKQKR